MNRKYTTTEYKQAVECLWRYFDKPAVTTDIIVGFPGETEEEFEETLRFAREIAFSQIHIFKYSRRRGTVADRMEHQVPEPVKSCRSDALEAVESGGICTANTINIDWNPDNNGAHTINQCTYEGAIEVPADPVKPGYTFTGWKLVE